MSTTNISEPKELLAWINSLLKAEYEKIEHLGNGAAYCQLIDMLFPQAMISMRDVNFSTTTTRESRQNFNQLRKALDKMRIRKVVLIQHLIRGSYEENLSFLKWFKTLFDKNNTKREYDVVAERNGSRLGYIQSADKAKAEQDPKVFQGTSKFESKSKTIVLKNSQEKVPKKTHPVEEILDAISKFCSKSEPINQKLPEMSELDSKAKPDDIQVTSQTGKFAALAIPEVVCEKISKLTSTKNAGLSTDGEVQDIESQSQLRSNSEGTSELFSSLNSSSVMAIPKLQSKDKYQVSMSKKATSRKEVPKKSIDGQKKSTKAHDKPQGFRYSPKEPISLNYLTRPQQIAHIQKKVVNIGKNMVVVGQERDLYYGKLRDIEKICLDFQNSSQNSENSSHGRGIIEAIKKSVSECLNSEHAK